MPSRSDVESLREANKSIAVLAQRELAAFYGTLNMNRPEVARTALAAFVADLVERYGNVAATVAADWYDNLRAASGVPGRFEAQLAPVVSAERVEAKVRYAAGGLFGQNLDTLGLLNVAASKYVLEPGRLTVAQSTARDPGRPKWARVPTGGSTCAFCRLLASRGAVYWTERSAGGDMHRFHGDCDCVATPVWPGDDLPYDSEALYAEYASARDETGQASQIKPILAAMRQQSGAS